MSETHGGWVAHGSDFAPLDDPGRIFVSLPEARGGSDPP